MEHISGAIGIRDIFLDNGHWWKLFLKKPDMIRLSIVRNVVKILSCRTPLLGYHVFQCLACGLRLLVPHTCKSRFCTSCGKKATDQWIAKAFARLPDTTWQHIIFTLPGEFPPLIWANRHLMKKIPKLAADIILAISRQKGFMPGIYLVIHTFGRDLKRNFHVHLSTTVGGLLIPCRSKWKGGAYFHHEVLKRMWRYAVIDLLRSEFKAGGLIFPPSLAHLAKPGAFNSWLNWHYQKSWVVQLGKQTSDRKTTIEYFGRYLKRPPVSETRITRYDGHTVTFEFRDHYTGELQEVTLSATDFLERLIRHIPDHYFRNIRYYGFLSNALSGKLMPTVLRLTRQISLVARQITWRGLVAKFTAADPLACAGCGGQMSLIDVIWPPRIKDVLKLHPLIANGYFQRI